jgi:hypothetical protein
VSTTLHVEMLWRCDLSIPTFFINMPPTSMHSHSLISLSSLRSLSRQFIGPTGPSYLYFNRICCSILTRSRTLVFSGSNRRVSKVVQTYLCVYLADPNNNRSFKRSTSEGQSIAWVSVWCLTCVLLTVV